MKQQDQLLNKKDDLEMVIADKKPDIMLFTEVIPKAQINPIHETQIKIDGYEHYSNFNFTDSNLGSSGIRGVVIYVKESLNCKEVKPATVYKDHVWVELSQGKKESLLCGCVYRRPTKENEETKKTTEDVCKVLNEMNNQGKSILICGDFNYPEIDWTNEYVGNACNTIATFVDTIQENHLYQHIFKPTRYRVGNDPSLLDLIFTNEEGMIKDIHHKPGLGESDHECIDFIIEYARSEVKKKAKENFFKGDYPTIRTRLKQLLITIKRSFRAISTRLMVNSLISLNSPWKDAFLKVQFLIEIRQIYISRSQQFVKKI